MLGIVCRLPPLDPLGRWELCMDTARGEPMGAVLDDMRVSGASGPPRTCELPAMGGLCPPTLDTLAGIGDRTGDVPQVPDMISDGLVERARAAHAGALSCRGMWDKGPFKPSVLCISLGDLATGVQGPVFGGVHAGVTMGLRDRCRCTGDGSCTILGEDDVQVIDFDECTGCDCPELGSMALPTDQGKWTGCTITHIPGLFHGVSGDSETVFAKL